MPDTHNSNQIPVHQEQQRGQLEASNAFSIKGVSVLEFTFKAHPDGLGQSKTLALNTSVASQATKKSGGHYSVITQVDISSADGESLVGFESFAEILILIETNPEFDEALLKNAVAISYSYLRPLIAQMTVMSKLPPLDLQPLDFSHFNVEVVDKKSSQEGIAPQ